MKTVRDVLEETVLRAMMKGEISNNDIDKALSDIAEIVEREVEVSEDKTKKIIVDWDKKRCCYLNNEDIDSLSKLIASEILKGNIIRIKKENR